MDKFNIVLTPKAVKDLDGFNDKQCKKILDDIRLLEENPFPRGKLIKKIKGTKKNYYRLRIDNSIRTTLLWLCGGEQKRIIIDSE